MINRYYKITIPEDEFISVLRNLYNVIITGKHDAITNLGVLEKDKIPPHTKTCITIKYPYLELTFTILFYPKLLKFLFVSGIIE